MTIDNKIRYEQLKGLPPASGVDIPNSWSASAAGIPSIGSTIIAKMNDWTVFTFNHGSQQVYPGKEITFPTAGSCVLYMYGVDNTGGSWTGPFQINSGTWRFLGTLDNNACELWLRIA